MLRAKVALSVLLCSSACGSPQATTVKVSPQATPAGDEAAAAEPKADGDGKRAALLSRVREMKRETTEIMAAYANGTLGDKLAPGELLLIDAKAPPSTVQTEFFVLPEPFTPPAPSEPQLRERWQADKQHVQRLMVGGIDGARPGLARKVVPGTYTVCAVVGPPGSPEREAYLARAKAAYGMQNGGADGPVDAGKLASALRKAEQEAGYKQEKIAWETLTPRCKQVVVTEDVGSRVVVLPAS